MRVVFGHPIPLWIIIPTFIVGWVFTAWTLKGLLFIWFARITRKTDTKLDDILVSSLNIPLAVMILVWGVAVLFRFVIPQELERWVHPVLMGSKMATILSAIIFIDLFISNLVSTYAANIQILRTSQSFTTLALHVLVWGLGALIALDSFGISITPIIASLGIGSLAVALALQPTLENAFAGIQIILDKLVIPGQFIKLESGDEGYVEKVGWRSTWVRQLSNNMIIIPNKQLTNSRILNFYYPSKDTAVTIELGVHFGSDLEKVERITSAVGEEVMKTVEGADPEFKPFIRFHTMAASGINFTVVLRAREFTDNYLIKHEFIKKVVPRYAKEGIIVPYPVVALNTSQEKAGSHSVN